MRVFRWVSANEIPPGLDLRSCGWRLDPVRGGSASAVALAHCGSMDTLGWVRFLIVHRQDARKSILLTGVRDSGERAQLLRLGFGEVLGDEAGLGEVEARAARLAENAGALPRHRELAGLRLDLFARDGFVQDGSLRERPLGLHPREFALLWRLAETPGVPVGKAELIRDVWRRNHVPETNSLAVHVFRLREKLRARGFARLVRTTPDGSYVLAQSRPRNWPADSADAMALPLPAKQPGQRVPVSGEPLNDA